MTRKRARRFQQIPELPISRKVHAVAVNRQRERLIDGRRAHLDFNSASTSVRAPLNRELRAADNLTRSAHAPAAAWSKDAFRNAPNLAHPESYSPGECASRRDGLTNRCRGSPLSS